MFLFKIRAKKAFFKRQNAPTTIAKTNETLPQNTTKDQVHFNSKVKADMLKSPKNSKI